MFVAYTKSMSFPAKPTAAPTPKTKNIRTISLGLAAVFTILATAQLFTFEKFPGVIGGIWLPAGELSSVYAAVIATLEVAALPFLLAMRLSLAMRMLSMVAGWLAVAVWLGVSLWENLSGNVVGNSGFLGDTLSLPVGWWSVFAWLALGILVGWVSWGMWPFTPKKRP